MATSSKIFDHNDCSKKGTRPLTLKEVLCLRNGIEISSTPDLSYPYEIQKFANNETILLALNWNSFLLNIKNLISPKVFII